MRYKFDDDAETIIEGKTLVVVAPIPGNRMRIWKKKDKLFGAKGDSGATVFNHQGKVVGIYIGGQDACDREHSALDPPVEKDLAVGGIHFVSPIGPNLDSIRTAVQKDPSFNGASVDVEFLWGEPW